LHRRSGSGFDYFRAVRALVPGKKHRDQTIHQENEMNVNVYRGVAPGVNSVSAGDFFTTDRDVAEMYALRSAWLATDPEFPEDVYSIDEMDFHSIHHLARMDGVEEGVVIEAVIHASNVLDLTELGHNFSSAAWNHLVAIGLIDDAWESIDVDIRREIKADIKTVWRLIEEEGTMARAEKLGFDALKFSDVGVDGQCHDTFVVFNDQQIELLQVGESQTVESASPYPR